MVVLRQNMLRALCREFEDISLTENGWGSPFVNLEDETMDESSALVVASDRLTLFARWDYQLLDAEALLQAGRQASHRLWPQDSEQAVRERIDVPVAAATELLHESPLTPLSGASGIEEVAHSSVFVAHDGDEVSEEEMFQLVRLHLTRE